MVGVEQFRHLVSPKIQWRYGQHVGEYCRDEKELLQPFCEGGFSEMDNHFLQDFSVVHCFNGVALIYSVLIQKILLIKKKIIITFPALRTILDFFGTGDVKIFHREVCCFDFGL